jgi:Xaa-Pro aminopeptidase
MRKLLLCFVLSSVSCCLPALGLDRQPNADYHARRDALAKKLNGGVALIFADMEGEGANALHGFRQNDNFFYLTGWSEPGAVVLVASAREAKDSQPARPATEILFLPSRDMVGERWTGPKLGPDSPEASATTGFDRVEALSKLDEELPKLLIAADKVYTELAGPGEITSSSGVLEWLKRTRAISSRPPADARPLLASLRVIKDAREIDLIKKATEASMAAHRAVMRQLKPGMTEREVGAILHYEWERRGCERDSYAPIVGAGFNGTVLHYSENSGVARPFDTVVIDAAGEYSMYATDITRTLPANGKFTARQREIYDIVLGAQQAAMAAFQSGKSSLRRETPDTLDKVARDYIESHGKDLHGESLGKYFIHGLGHYVGLNVHDDGDYTIPLSPGMVFTIEPGIYIPEEKLGVRIEDMYYVNQEGKLIQLTADLPRTADAVERAMAGK